MMIQTNSPAARRGGGPAGRGARGVIFIYLLLAALIPSGLAANDLVAVTESGKKVVIARVEKDTEAVAITLKNRGFTMKDPVVEITGLSDLNRLRDLSFYHVPQIISFDFLGDCVSLKRLVISFARVISADFLSGLPNLELLHLEICDDWESSGGLPFLSEPLDLSVNNRLEYLAFRICGLNRVPVIVNAPETLEVLDISYNAIDIDETDAPALEALRRVERIFVSGNTVTQAVLEANKNILFENSDPLLSEYMGE